MGRRQYATEREVNAFLRGQGRYLRLGRHGATVHVDVVDDGTVRVRRSSAPRRQVEVGPDAPEVRERAVEAARALVGRIGGNGAQASAEEADAGEEELTLGRIWHAYLRHLLPGCPREALEHWGPSEVVAHLRQLSPEARRNAKKADTIVTALQSARRMAAYPELRLDASYDRLEGGHVEEYVNWALNAAGRRASTVRTDLRRLRSAVRHVKTKWAKTLWKGRGDVTDPLPKVEAKSQVPEIGEERASLVIDALWGLGLWRAWATCQILRFSGRRVGAIAADRGGNHDEAPPLTAADILEETGEEAASKLLFRAEAQKGGGYDHPSGLIPVEGPLAEVLDHVREHHPNPLGPEHPLIWSPRNPRRAVSYAALSKDLKRAWRHAFGEAPPRGLGFHGFCRTVITTLCDELGIAAAAQYTGRSKDIVVRHYYRPRAEKQAEAARLLARRANGASAPEREAS